jgi:flagellin-like hook-associated protein FlgL
MINNTTLMHINRNMRQLDSIIRQLETTKRVSRPSDDPLIASRALKFRAGVREVQQFQRNVQFGQAWMDISESSFLNILDNQLQEIRRLLVGGANGTYNIDNKTTMINQIRELTDHIATLEMNQTYAGRYVFSGFRTDEQPVFTAGNERRFIATQHFALADVDRTATFQRIGADSATDIPLGNKVNVLRLAYRGIDMRDPATGEISREMTPENIANTRIYVQGFHVIPVSIHNADAYLPPAEVGGVPALHFVVETGELVMHDSIAANFPREGIAVTFEKTNFARGEINPSVYFTSREMIDEEPDVINADRVYQVTQYFSRVAATGTETIDGQEFYVFDLAHTASFLDPDDPEGLRPRFPTGAIISADEVRIPALYFAHNQQISVSYSVEIAGRTDPATVPTDAAILAAMNDLKRDLRVQGVSLLRASVPGSDPLEPIPIDQAERNRTFDMHDQIMTIEAAAHTHVGINALAKNVFTPQMFADLRRLVEFADGIHISDEGELRARLRRDNPSWSPEEVESYLDRQLIEERAIANDALFTVFDNALRLIDRHIDQITREHTQLGARGRRLEMLHFRLEADEVSYERLTSQNEDTDIARAIMMRVNAHTAFEASLRANSGIMQMTLANFIN